MFVCLFVCLFALFVWLLSNIADISIRLVDGDFPGEGRVEVYRNGAWGTVTSYGWDSNDAAVVCRSLGYGGAGSPVWWAAFGAGTGSIMMDNVRCNGNEPSIFDCTNSAPLNDYHSEDAGVRCQGEERCLYSSYI